MFFICHSTKKHYICLMKSLLLVGFGGFLGSVLRYSIQLIVSKGYCGFFPIATFLANIAGCFLIGIFYGLATKYSIFDGGTRLLLTTGFCGGFTTFSTLSYESFKLLEAGQYITFIIYISSSFIVGVFMVMAGIWMVI